MQNFLKNLKGMLGGITKIPMTGTITHTTSTDMDGIAFCLDGE